MNDIRDILADNLISLMNRSADKKSQNALAKSSAKLGDGKIGQTTIGNILRAKTDKSLPFPKLDTLDNLAKMFGITVAQLLTENFGRSPEDQREPSPQPSSRDYSSSSQEIAERLAAIESSGSASPQLLRALHAVLDVAAPPTGGNGYPGLDKLPEE